MPPNRERPRSCRPESSVTARLVASAFRAGPSPQPLAAARVPSALTAAAVACSAHEPCLPGDPQVRLPHGRALTVPPFSRRYAIPPEHGKRLERLAIGRCLRRRGGPGGEAGRLAGALPSCFPAPSPALTRSGPWSLCRGPSLHGSAQRAAAVISGTRVGVLAESSVAPARAFPSPQVVVQSGGDLAWASELLGDRRPRTRSCDSPGLPQQVSLPAATVPPPALSSPGLPRGFVTGAQAASAEGHGLEVKAGPGVRDPWSDTEVPGHPEGGTGSWCPVTPVTPAVWPMLCQLERPPLPRRQHPGGGGWQGEAPSVGSPRHSTGPISGRPDCPGSSDKQSSPRKAATEPCGSHCSASARPPHCWPPSSGPSPRLHRDPRLVLCSPPFRCFALAMGVVDLSAKIGAPCPSRTSMALVPRE